MSTAATIQPQASATLASPRPAPVLIVTDDQSWVWQSLRQAIQRAQVHHLRIPSDVRLRPSWTRLGRAPRFVVHWEAQRRPGPAIIEEIRSIEPGLDLGERVLVVTHNPTREDVVYFSELGIKRVVRMRQRTQDAEKAETEIAQHLTARASKSPHEDAWHQTLQILEALGPKTSPDNLSQLEQRIEALRAYDGGDSARSLDAQGHLAFLRRDMATAHRLWLAAIDKNPNYFRTYNHLVNFYRHTGQHSQALALMQKLQTLNTNNISRLVSMGETYHDLKEPDHAEHYYRSAMSRDPYCDRALSGLAMVKFEAGNLEESRELFAASTAAQSAAAAQFNRIGIELVAAQRYQEALEHYTRAQYVLPTHEQSALIFYNMGLCCAKWGRYGLSRRYLEIALTKRPDYPKAQELLTRLVRA